MQSRHIRQSKSCKRCLRRKQRCHGFPICTNCEKANQPCQQSDFALELHRHDDKYTALKRIQTLETQLKNALAELSTVRQQQGQEFVTAGSPTSHFETNSGVPSPVGRGQTSEHEIHRFSSEDTPQCSTMNHDTGDMNIDVRAADAHNVNYNRNSAGGMPTFSPSFSNVDSGFESSKEHTVVEPSSVPTLEHIVQATVWTKVLPPTFNEKVSLSAGSDVPPQIVTPPADEIGRKIIKTYFDKIHPRYPFLYRAEINKLHARRHHTGQPSPAIRFDIFKLNMVYAIGATLLQQTESYADILPESFFMAALQHVSAVRQSPALQCIEAMALLVLYNLRSPCNSGIWHMIGLAMRTCIDLGLQRESSYAKGTTMENQMKRRLFWTIYSLDRIISLSLRRPFSIPDQDIDTNPPSPDDCLIRDAESPIGPLTPNHSLNITGPTLWVRFIQIKRLESRIYSEVYRLDETQQLRFARVKPLLESLDAWTQCFSTLTESDRDYMFLLSSKAVLLLLRPFLTMMRPDDILITRCLKASGQICEAFKRMHQRDSYSHSFVSAHSTFNAGVTICYCLFLNPHLLSPAVSNSLRACSSTMFVMAERSHRFRKHRDVLEDIINRVMESASKASSGSGYLDNRCTAHFAERDILAVQSLMELSAQQDPPIGLEINIAEQATTMFTKGMGRAEEQPDFRTQDFCNEDRYSLQMLDEMMAFETGPW